MRLSTNAARSPGVWLTMATALMAEPNYHHQTGTWLLTMPEGSGSFDHLPPVNDVPTPEVLPSLPDGTQLDLFERTDMSDPDSVGGRVWRGAGEMCRWLRDEHELVHGTTVLELGAGTGASGLYAGCIGASHVLMTDGGPQEVVDNLAVNIDRHNGRFPPATTAAAASYRFGDEPLPVGEFELVIGSDITYSVREDRDALCRTLVPLLTRGARVVMAHEHRRSTMFDVEASRENVPAATWEENDYALQLFLEAADENGLRVEPLNTRFGSRAVDADGVVHMTLDLSILEVALK